MKFQCPKNMAPHVERIFAGEYDIDGVTLGAGDVILDIGANVGAFAVWARRKWPGADIRCYEPHPEAWSMLINNVSDPFMYPMQAYELAVRQEGHPRVGKLYDGVNNLGEASMYAVADTGAAHDVAVIYPRELPAALIMKLDCEGAEMEILREYPHVSELRAVLVEYHRPEYRRQIEDLLTGFTLVGGQIYSAETGVLKFTRPQSAAY